MQAEPQDVHRRLEQMGCASRHEHAERRVAVDHFPPSVDDHGRIRLVPAQHQLQRFADGRKLRLLEAVLRVGRGVAAGQQQLVALAQRHFELFGQPQDHFRRRPRSSRLDEAQMPRRDVGLDGQIELAQPTSLAPLA
jgi:hypothetical protein